MNLLLLPLERLSLYRRNKGVERVGIRISNLLLVIVEGMHRRIIRTSMLMMSDHNQDVWIEAMPSKIAIRLN